MIEYLIHAIYWDIVKTPRRNNKPTKKYIDECASRGLPLPHTRVHINAESPIDAIKKLEEMYNTKTKWASAQGPMLCQ